MDGMDMKTVMTTGNMSVISYDRDGCNRAEGHSWQKISHWSTVQQLKINRGCQHTADQEHSNQQESVCVHRCKQTPQASQQRRIFTIKIVYLSIPCFTFLRIRLLDCRRHVCQINLIRKSLLPHFFSFCSLHSYPFDKHWWKKITTDILNNMQLFKAIYFWKVWKQSNISVIQSQARQ